VPKVIDGAGRAALGIGAPFAHTSIMEDTTMLAPDVAIDRPAIDRLDLEILPFGPCWDLVASAPIGRVAFLDNGEPAVFPVTHAVIGRRIVFRSQAGAKLAAASVGRTVAFEVDAWDAVERTGWSVLVRGVADLVDDPLEVARLEALDLEPWAPAVRGGSWIQIRADEVSGRRLGRDA